jgi:hypothetical protein
VQLTNLNIFKANPFAFFDRQPSLRLRLPEHDFKPHRFAKKYQLTGIKSKKV